MKQSILFMRFFSMAAQNLEVGTLVGFFQFWNILFTMLNLVFMNSDGQTPGAAMIISLHRDNKQFTQEKLTWNNQQMFYN